MCDALLLPQRGRSDERGRWLDVERWRDPGTERGRTSFVCGAARNSPHQQRAPRPCRRDTPSAFLRSVFCRGFVRRFYLRWLTGLSSPPATKERKQGEVLQVRALRASGAEGVVGPTDIHLTSCRDDPATPNRRMRSILQRNEVPHHSVSLRETALPFRESRCHLGIVNACESQNREMRHSAFLRSGEKMTTTGANQSPMPKV